MFYISKISRTLRANKYPSGCLPVARSMHRLMVLLICLFTVNAPGYADLTLSEAEIIALANDPGIDASNLLSQALIDDAVADGQLPDPKIKAGLFNLPLDSFDIEKEPTTQLRLGFEQAFPQGETLQLRQRRTEFESFAEQARADDTARKVYRDVRSQFLELYYQVRAGEVVDETRDLFSQLVDITQAHYATGRVRQQDVLRASLELSRLEDRSMQIRNEAEKSRASLSKWIGDAAMQPVSRVFPALPELPEKEQIEEALQEHPVIRSQTALIEASKQSIQISREKSKPGWSVGLEYRKRFGEDSDGDDRSDMMAAMISVNMPMFKENRQDQRIAASIKRADAAQLKRANDLRELKNILDSNYATWERFGDREALYETQLIREARANSRASLKAYQSGVTEFTTLMRARITDLDVRLEELRIRVDRAKAQARLLYLAGDKK